MAFSHSTALLKSQLLWCCDTSYQGPDLNLRILNWCIVHRCKFVRHVQALGYPENKIYYEWTIDFGNFGKTDACQLVVCHRCGIQANINQKDVNFSLCEWIMNMMNSSWKNEGKQKRHVNHMKQSCEIFFWFPSSHPIFSIRIFLWPPSGCSESCTFRPSERWHFTVTAFQRRLCQVKESNHQWCCTAKVLKWRVMMDDDVMWIWCDVEIVEMWDIFKRQFTNTPVWKKLVLAKDAG